VSTATACVERSERDGLDVDEQGRYWARTGGRRTRVGGQDPTFKRIGDYHHSYGSEVVEVFTDWGTAFYDCQRDELTLFLARSEDDRFASKTICISKPRQNGKSFSSRKYAIWMAAGEGKKVLYSAHNGSTVRKMFKFIRDEIRANPELFDELDGGDDGIYSSKGSEGIYFRNGGCIEFQTRTSSGALGNTYDVIVVDEAQQLTYDQQDAIKPTTIASDSGDPQMIYVGTPPKPTEPGEVFRDFYDQAHDLTQPCPIWWLEWSVPEVPDMTDMDAVLELAWRTNPAMGRRIKVDVMMDAIASYRLRPESYARQYLGWWSPVADDGSRPIVSKERWDALVVEDAPKTWDRLAYGVRFTPDGRNVALSVCVASEKSAHVEFIRESPTVDGIGWLVGWLAERRKRFAAVAIDGKADVEDLFQQLTTAGIPRRAIIVARTQDAISANGMAINAINDKTLTHVDDEALEVAVTSARRRKIGNAGGFGFEGEFVERFDSIALALWAARTTRRNPNRKGRVGC
jgi:hypothetical protein